MISDVVVNFLFVQVPHHDTLETVRQMGHGGVPSILAHQYLHSIIMKEPFHLPLLSVSMAYVWECFNKQKDI